MSDDRTARMDQPDWSRRETGPDEQKTVMAGQESVTPPTFPMGDQGGRGWKEKTGPGFVRSEPVHPAGQPASGSSGPEGQTMIISERPSPVFAWLVIVDGPDRNSIGTVHTLHPDTTTLGRVSGNRIVLHDETVSAQHARIRREVKEGQEPVFALFDMGSRNGIYAGARENYKNEENRVYRHELKDGDYLLVGDTTLVFKTL
jgi:hypothetical protein